MTTMTTTSTKSGTKLNQKLGTGKLKQKVGTIGAYQQIMLGFINYITSVGAPPQIPADDKVPAHVTNAANAALTQLGTDFKSAQTAAQGLQSQVNGITDVVNASDLFARHGLITMKQILASIVQYKKDKTSVNQPALKSQINRMISNCDRLQRNVKSAHTNTSGAVKTLQHWEAALNTDFLDLQTAIPPIDGKKLNLNTLTEKAAMTQLERDVTSLNGKISSLQNEINWLTFGEVSVGVVGGLIAVTNCWNPIGWVAAGLTIYGEVEMVGKKADDTAALNTDLQNLALTQDEEAIVHPIYSIKNAVARLNEGVNAAEAIGKSLESLKDNFGYAASDLETFLDDVTNNISLKDLQSDVSYVESDYTTLQSFCTTLLNPLPSKVVPLSALAGAKNAPSS
jgi:hypothetical protein